MSEIHCPCCQAVFHYERQEQKPQLPDKVSWEPTKNPQVEVTNFDSLEAQAIRQLIGENQNYADQQAGYRYWIFNNCLYRIKT